MTGEPDIGWRIGELSRRVGVSADVLRAWERRYGVLSPRRSAAGQRLYTERDERRIRDMRASIEQGYAPAVAARLALAGEEVGARAEAAGDRTAGDRRFPRSREAAEAEEQGGAGVHDLEEPTAQHLLETLSASLDAFDDGGANGVVDRLLAVHGLEPTICDVILPTLHDIGARWARNEVTVAQEHFASALLMGRLRSLSRGWDEGDGPRALMACPSGESHDLGLLCFSLLLRQRGCRITYLGASVPGDALYQAADGLQPDIIVVSAVREEPFWNNFEALSELSYRYPMAIGGAGATQGIADQLSARLLPHDPRAAVAAVSRVSLG